jgi:hypothetical protein
MRIMAEFEGWNPEHHRALLPRALAALEPGELPEHRKQLVEMLEEWVVEGQRSGEFRADAPPGELAGFLMGLQFQATLTWAYGFVQGSLADHQVRVLQLALEGICTRRGD